jgi:hypothetical protein
MSFSSEWRCIVEQSRLPEYNTTCPVLSLVSNESIRKVAMRDSIDRKTLSDTELSSSNDEDGPVMWDAEEGM